MHVRVRMLACAGVGHALKYYQDSRMHNLGNVGFGGRIHAMFAPLATAAITERVYGGFEPRKWLHAQLPNATCVDLGCGVGISTRPGDLGIDASHEMIERARLIGPDKVFLVADVEDWEGRNFAAATLAFVTHEMPRSARMNAMHNALKIAPLVHVMDIDTTYTPSAAMLTGEPYLSNYLEFMNADVRVIATANDAELLVNELIPGHVRVWTLTIPATRPALFILQSTVDT